MGVAGFAPVPLPEIHAAPAAHRRGDSGSPRPGPFSMDFGTPRVGGTETDSDVSTRLRMAIRFDLLKTTCNVVVMTKLAPPESATLADAVRAVGLKATAPRLAVLGMLQNAPHSSAEDVFGSVRDELPGTSVQAVYGVLAAFTAAGLVRRIDPAGSPARFECRIGDNHHHVLCVRCGDLKDVDCVIGAAPCLTASDTSGFTIQAAEVTFTGVCVSCQKQVAHEDSAS